MAVIKLTAEQLHEMRRNTYMIWIYMDQAEKCITNIESICRDKDIKRQVVKQKLTAMSKLATDFRNELNQAHKNNPDTLERFGEASDAIEIQQKTDLYYSLKKELNL